MEHIDVFGYDEGDKKVLLFTIGFNGKDVFIEVDNTPSKAASKLLYSGYTVFLKGAPVHLDNKRPEEFFKHLVSHFDSNCAYMWAVKR